MHVASRTGSHAFPRDLRGSHPRDHGGNGEKVENGVAPGEGDAAQRERVGKSDECGGGVCVCWDVRREVGGFVSWCYGHEKNTRNPPPSFCFLRVVDFPTCIWFYLTECQPEQCVRAGRFNFLRNCTSLEYSIIIIIAIIINIIIIILLLLSLGIECNFSNLASNIYIKYYIFIIL